MSEEIKAAVAAIEPLIRRGMPISDCDEESIVRATLIALREPTPGMVKASNKTANSHAADKWRAIIDYVLGDAP